MNIRDLQYLVAVYDLNSFSKAAEECFVSQPTLSGQLKKMEIELGAVLMERSTRKVIFTPLGKIIAEEARDILNKVEHIKSLAKESDDPMQGDFHIGLIPTIGPFLLPKIVLEINTQFPQMNLFLHELQTDVLIDKLLKGKLDAAILAKLDWDYPIKEFQLYQEDFILAVSANDSLANTKQIVDRSVLDGRSVLMLEDGHCLRDQALGVCFAAGANEDKRYQATSMDTLLHMVATGAGITLVPEMACNKDIQGVEYLVFSKPAPNREVVIVTRNNIAREQAIKNIANLITSIV
ncbi:MAG: DNA-binding transcriptional regulator OxyR [Pseudomonadales bacterium]|nr:DNA-binding transcriptional regulator OxyR [Pseudomonadales bacterium]